MRNLSNRSAERRRARAAAGAALLDRLVPGWWRAIRLRELDINDGCKCITGQLFGNYAKGLDKLNLDEIDARYYGFMAMPETTDDPGMWALTRAWKNEIRQRRAGDRKGRVYG